MPSIDAANRAIAAAVARLADAHGTHRIAFCDCGDLFLNASALAQSGRHGPDSIVRADWMPDQLHPNADGHAALLNCLMPQLERLRAAQLRQIRTPRSSSGLIR
jgi:lysophospholipase L1-like esterase